MLNLICFINKIIFQVNTLFIILYFLSNIVKKFFFVSTRKIIIMDLNKKK